MNFNHFTKTCGTVGFCKHLKRLIFQNQIVLIGLSGINFHHIENNKLLK